MIKKCIITLFIIYSFTPADLMAGMKLYLLPEVHSKANLCIADVVKFDRMSGDAENAGKLPINENITKDGFIDKNEIISLLKESGFNSFLIYGHSVKIETQDRDEDIKAEKIFIVRAGEEVTLTIKKRTITLSMRATALSDGTEGEIIPVKLKAGKKIMARVSCKGRLVKNL